MSRESMELDVVVVGAGPAGLATACRLAQLARAAGRELQIGVVEKGAAVGAHIVSGAVFEPRALDELFPDWRERGAPVKTPVTAERVEWLASAKRSIRVPELLVPRALRNHGNFIISLGDLCQWLAGQAESLGVNVLPGFAAADLLYDGERVAGVVTGDLGIARDGSHKPTYQPGYELRAKYTVLAEGCRGHLGGRVEARFALRAGADPQHYAIGFKEIWQVDAAKHRLGEIVHTLGWPLDAATDGGGFVYHAADARVYLGLVVSLAYRNPHLDPFAEFQRWKQHPAIRLLLARGERIAYGARAVNKGGLQSLPKLTFRGGLLVGCEAGFLNPAKIKGSHAALKSGMLAAETIFAALALEGAAAEAELARYDERVRESWLWDELRRGRNFSAGVAKLGTFLGGALAFVEQNLLQGRAPWTLHNRVPDHARLREAAHAPRPRYARPDGVVAFDRSSSVFLSGTAHEENQPSHLKLADPSVPIAVNLPRYDEPAQRYCPAGVYEVVADSSGAPCFRINATNCVHCKTCDIKDPAQNITWVPPEGGGGPNYSGM
ncbi:MAG TPA: electron transfer flavoprotein-ubiquinone oxidoreductase [Gammaproteobacteria bacterium]|nr:electron transfer flavoprotein-ubiquinone oxidoreductase [Gammaproteobacteria bacterium]